MDKSVKVSVLTRADSLRARRLLDLTSQAVAERKELARANKTKVTRARQVSARVKRWRKEDKLLKGISSFTTTAAGKVLSTSQLYTPLYTATIDLHPRFIARYSFTRAVKKRVYHPEKYARDWQVDAVQVRGDDCRRYLQSLEYEKKIKDSAFKCAIFPGELETHHHRGNKRKKQRRNRKIKRRLQARGVAV